MKKALFILTVIFFAATSCKEREINYSDEESLLTISIVDCKIQNGTVRAPSVDGENSINNLEILIFRKTGDPSKSILDTYKQLSAADLSDLSSIQIKTTVGEKHIEVIANSHNSLDINQIHTLEDYHAIIHQLQNDNPGDFLMTGSTDEFLKINTKVSVTMKRMVGRIILANVKTDFSGSPYEGQKISNVKAYLINVKGNKYLYNGESPSENDKIVNRAALSSDDLDLFSDPSMLFEEIPGQIGSEGYGISHSFYCYENSISIENEEDRFTRLVVQADLMGKTYYYPINVNQENYGFEDGNNHHGIKRNHSYTISLTILRPGSDDPDIPVDRGIMSLGIVCAPWEIMPESNIII